MSLFEMRRWQVFLGGHQRSDSINHYALEAWERMTTGGMSVVIDENPPPVDPWGIYRFAEPAPSGGLRLRALYD